MNDRSGAESGISVVEDDDDSIELEKSNVLLMGPTGSGMVPTSTFVISFACSRIKVLVSWKILHYFCTLDWLLSSNNLPNDISH